MAQADQPLDLVIGDGYPTDNRWKQDNAVIEIESIRTPADLPALMGILGNLRRVKIFELEREPVLELMDALGAADRQWGNLMQLEIDLLRLHEGTAITYAFVALEFLSIDRVWVDDALERERPEEAPVETTIVFDAPTLRTVCLGK